MKVNRFLLDLRRDFERREVRDESGGVCGVMYRPRARRTGRPTVHVPDSPGPNLAGLLIAAGLALGLSIVVLPLVFPMWV
jgi:hypothetical protein